MTMKSPFSLRLALLSIALLAVAVGVVYGIGSAWHQVRQLEWRFTASQVESFRLAGEAQRRLLNLNTSLLRYALVRDPREWTEFDAASRDFDRWTDDFDPALNPHSPLTTETERQTFTELNRAYEDYLSAARAVHTNGQPALVSAKQLTQLDAFNRQAQRMRELARRLAEAHRSAEATFFAETGTSLTHVQGVLVASVVLLLSLVGAMGWVIYRDMIAPLRTKLVQSQTLLERQQKLATLGTLAAGIAHEIRNPLTSLKARLYTLEKHLQVAPAARRDTDIIAAEITRLERIVQDVLSFARPADPRLEIIAAEDVIREVQGLMSPSLENRRLRFVVESSPELLIRADSGHLKQVLVNLIRNAAEAIEGTGTVTLRTRAARAELAGGETNVVLLEVADTGRGIPAEVEKRLFDPFFSTKETGTGLGLAIAARIVERLGGLLQYRTSPGHGTTFGIVLPRANRPQESSQQPTG